jgi:anthranilate synthase component 2
VIAPESLPAELEVTAKTWDDEIMGVRHRAFVGTAAPLEGVQFHPESIMTQGGKAMLANFLAQSGVATDERGRGRALAAATAEAIP